MFINVCFRAILGGASHRNIWLPVSHPQSGSQPKAACLAWLSMNIGLRDSLIFKIGLNEDGKGDRRRKTYSDKYKNTLVSLQEFDSYAP